MIKIKPKKWYQWFNPYWWRTKKTIEAIMDFTLKEHEEELNERIMHNLIYGETLPFKTTNEKPTKTTP